MSRFHVLGVTRVKYIYETGADTLQDAVTKGYALFNTIKSHGHVIRDGATGKRYSLAEGSSMLQEGRRHA